MPARPALSPSVTRICVTGFKFSHNSGRSARLAREISQTFPDKYEAWFHFDNGFRGGKEDGGFLAEVKADMQSEDKEKFANFKSAPFVWFEAGEPVKLFGKGGNDRFCEWAISEFPDDPKILELAKGKPSVLFELLVPLFATNGLQQRGK